MRVHRILKETAAEGPGLRYCVWVQGCSHHCPGCFAKDTWDSEKGRWIEIEDIKEDLRRAIQSAAEKGKDLEGLTLLGGEPFDQAQEAVQLAKEAKKHGLSVLTFTGYRLEELRKKGPAERKLLKRTDLLIDGPFEEEKKSFDRPLVGSSNQRFHFLHWMEFACRYVCAFLSDLLKKRAKFFLGIMVCQALWCLMRHDMSSLETR